ncbi:hypothetical protein K7G98_41885, partial [Saccharothrix sp. MB29]|nr:hypothetical protein [Saccharothrix sp. MB29]
MYEARGVGNSRAASGSEGPPVCVRCVQFFASKAVGVGSSGSRFGDEGPSCLPVVQVSSDEPSCAVGVDCIPVSSTG